MQNYPNLRIRNKRFRIFIRMKSGYDMTLKLRDSLIKFGGI